MNLNLTLVLEIISFLILMALLSRLLYRPILQVISRRQEEIDRSIDSANKALDEANRNLKDSQKNLKDTEGQIVKMKHQTQVQIEELRRKIEDEAAREAERVLKEAGEEIDRQFNAAQDRLKERISEFSVLIAEKILSREINPADHKRLIEEGVKEILASGKK